jgi:dTDP-4-dehydrorhamnose 3,5-epimerase
MKFSSLKIPELLAIEPKVYEDTRGAFFETYRNEIFAAAGIPHRFVQDNQSCSLQGVLRGLHYQIKNPQGKLVRVVFGEIFDVAVDLRRSSPTFGQWDGMVLSAKNRLQLWVPPGFAHGFYVISEKAEVTYKVTDIYTPEFERTLLWNDSTIGIDWPLRDDIQPILSKKDLEGKALAEAELFE